MEQAQAENARLARELAAASEAHSELRAALDEAEGEVQQLEDRIRAAERDAAAAAATAAQELAVANEGLASAVREHQEELSRQQLERGVLMRTHQDRMRDMRTQLECELRDRTADLDSLRSECTELRKRAAAAPGAARDSGAGPAIAAAAAPAASVEDDGREAPTIAGGTGQPKASVASTPAQSGLASLISGGRRSTSTGGAAETAADGRLAEAQRRLGQLQLLLAEAEETSERLEVQATVLKKEIRRLEANATRAEATNLEYLKNVVVRFIASAADERAALIPVLSKLLHLTSEETEQATAAFERSLELLREQLQPQSKGWGLGFM